MGDGAPCERDSVGDHKGRPYTRTARRQARVGATLAVAHLESSTASFPSREVACHALVASRTDPNEVIGKPAWATARPAGAIAWATTRVAPTPEQLGDRPA